MPDHRAFRALAAPAVLALAVTWSAGCASSYVTPGRGADLSLFGASRGLGDLTDPIEQRLARRPAASFPVNLAVVRVQDTGYRSYTSEGRGQGRYSVVTNRDVEADEDMARIAGLPGIEGVAAVGGLLLPGRLQDDGDLRTAAATLQCDMLLIYTFDTTFRVADTVEPLLGVVTLGLFPNKEARVSTTASAVLLDTRTAYVYGVAEASAKEDQIANAWTSREATDQSRLRAEERAFESLVEEFVGLWPAIVDGQRPKAGS